jgi:hypothetical protein
MNTALKEKMVKFYNNNAYTHNYIFGFRFNGNIWLVKVTSEILPFVLMLDKASRGAGYALRFKPNKAVKTLLLSKGATVLCSEQLFNQLCESSKYNKGEIFEKLVTEYFGQTWEKDTIPFWIQGDINVNGKEIQIKLDSATLINTKLIAKLKG